MKRSPTADASPRGKNACTPYHGCFLSRISVGTLPRHPSSEPAYMCKAARAARGAPAFDAPPIIASVRGNKDVEFEAIYSHHIFFPAGKKCERPSTDAVKWRTSRSTALDSGPDCVAATRCGVPLPVTPRVVNSKINKFN